jgi:hypothetical protein
LYIVQARPETIHSRRNLSKIIKMDYVNWRLLHWKT